MNATLQELVRQALRWLAVWLISIGLPDAMVEPLGNPATVEWVAAALSYGVAEVWWAWSKWRRR